MRRDGGKFYFEQDEQTPFVNRETDGMLFGIAVVIAKNFNAAQNKILPISTIQMPLNKSISLKPFSNENS